jgi:hypothetical protein
MGVIGLEGVDDVPLFGDGIAHPLEVGHRNGCRRVSVIRSRTGWQRAQHRIRRDLHP